MSDPESLYDLLDGTRLMAHVRALAQHVKLSGTPSVTLDKPARDKPLARASELAIGQDVAAIPVYFVRGAWAMRGGLHYDGYPQEATVASLVHQAQ
jgi:hypothetical protein